MSDDFFEIKDDCTFLKVRVSTRASKNAIVGIKNNELAVSVTAVPENGKANEAIIKLLSKGFKCAKSKIELVSGGKSRNKLFKIVEPLDLASILEDKVVRK